MFFQPRRREPPSMTLEGVLGPNNRIDEAAGFSVAAPECVCVAGGRLLFSSGKRVLSMRKWGETPEPWAAFDVPVTALSASAGGFVAVGLAGGKLAVHDSAGIPQSGWTLPQELASVADCIFLSEDEIAIVDSGYRAEENVLQVAPWDEVARGRLVTVARSGAGRTVAGGLHCPTGVSIDPAGKLIVSLFERAAIVDSAGKVLQSGYPAYLGRIERSQSGYVLACPSRRDALIEFLKTEPAFVAEMKATMEPRHWIGPRATPEFSHDFPIELGAARLFGEVKPWAPSFSYGLIIELDERFLPVASAHSRANRSRHAIADVALWNSELIAVSKASGEILNLGPGTLQP